MGESTKACLALVIIVGMVATVFAWFTDNPGAVAWSFRIGAPAMAAASLLFILKLHFRKDLAPDELRKVTGTYFNRGGFCFVPTVWEENGSCWFGLWYQNQFEGECIGQVALRPARGFFLTKSKFTSVSFEVPCGPGAFGMVRVPVPINREFQGKKIKFELGAAVRYHGARGRRLRFYDGIHLRTNTNFGSGFRTASTLR